MKTLLAATAFILAATPVLAQTEPDGLKLPPGFHASVVAEGLGAIRHLAVRDNGDLYVSTARARTGIGGGVIAIKMKPDHTAGETQHFGIVDGGTGIRFYHDALYATSPSRIWRIALPKGGLVPKPGEEPAVIVDGMPALSGSGNRQIAFDNKGNLYVAVSGSGNFCPDPSTPKGQPPVGLKPCPDMGKRAGVWRFSATKLNQQFPGGGEQIATGLRDLSSLDWSPADSSLYLIVHGRDGIHGTWPAISQADDDAIADEMHKITKGTDVGWPYTYYDGVKKQRLVAPEYGGDGKTVATGNYDVPVATFQNTRSAPVDLVFYTGKQFPAEYRNGAFVIRHGVGGAQSPTGKNGYDVVFIPFDKNGKAGDMKTFADGFAGPSPANKNNGKAAYRPVGAAVAPDGSLYISDSNKGRIWRISYGN
jgi:glucose/arabinose dehydrogenase